MIDFHIHTTFSDGTYSPVEVVRMAKEAGLKAFSITDHDTISGLSEAKQEAELLNIDFINGIELSTDYLGKEVHILGYFLNLEDEKLINKLRELKEERDKRALMLIEKLKKYKVEITMEDIMEEVPGDIISRMHVANVLVNKGYVRNKREAFATYLGDSGVAYIPKENLSPEDAVKMIKENGGLAFIAHPKLISIGNEKFKHLVDHLMKFGLDGIEVYYSGFTYLDILYYEKIAAERDLLISGGSDFHGDNREGTKIGENKAPEYIYEKMKEKIEQKSKSI